MPSLIELLVWIAGLVAVRALLIRSAPLLGFARLVVLIPFAAAGLSHIGQYYSAPGTLAFASASALCIDPILRLATDFAERRFGRQPESALRALRALLPSKHHTDGGFLGDVVEDIAEWRFTGVPDWQIWLRTVIHLSVAICQHPKSILYVIAGFLARSLIS